MRLSTHYPTLFASILLLSSSTFALPVPGNNKKTPSGSTSSQAAPKDPAAPEDPLPGRTAVTQDSTGLVTGHYGDDFLPQHMRHVQDNQEEFPQNKEPFDYNPFGAKERPQKIGGASVGPHPVTGDPRVKDEKPLASQKIPGSDNPGTTFQALSHKESGGLPPTKLEKEDAANGKPPTKPPTDGSSTTELQLTNKMTAQAKDAKAKGKKNGGKMKITPNPGWQEMKTDQNSQDPQLRAHEAPAVMQTVPHTNKPETDLPAADSKGKAKQPADDKGKSTKGKQSAPPTVKPPPDPQSRKGSLRQGTITQGMKQPEPNPPKDPKKPSTGSSGDATQHPNYRPSRPQVPNQYKPGTPDSKSPTPGIAPPAEDPARLPPRPQNKGSEPPKPAPPRTTPLPQASKDDSAVKGPLQSGPFKKLPDDQKNDYGIPASLKNPGKQPAKQPDEQQKPTAELPSRPIPAPKPAAPKQSEPEEGSSGTQAPKKSTPQTPKKSTPGPSTSKTTKKGGK